MTIQAAVSAYASVTAAAPGWLQENINHYNAVAVLQYTAALAGWKQSCAEWLQNYSQIVLQGQTPPPAPAIPTQGYSYWDGHLGFLTVLCQDDTLVLPKAPVVKPAGTPGGPVPSISLSSGASDFNAELMGRIQALGIGMEAIQAGLRAVFPQGGF